MYPYPHWGHVLTFRTTKLWVSNLYKSENELSGALAFIYTWIRGLPLVTRRNYDSVLWIRIFFWQFISSIKIQMISSMKFSWDYWFHVDIQKVLQESWFCWLFENLWSFAACTIFSFLLSGKNIQQKVWVFTLFISKSKSWVVWVIETGFCCLGKGRWCSGARRYVGKAE